jgi:hypothetical protein
LILMKLLLKPAVCWKAGGCTVAARDEIRLSFKKPKHLCWVIFFRNQNNKHLKN